MQDQGSVPQPLRQKNTEQVHGGRAADGWSSEHRRARVVKALEGLGVLRGRGWRPEHCVIETLLEERTAGSVWKV